MAEHLEEKLKREHAFISDLWRLRKKYIDVKSDDEYWHELMAEAGQLFDKYKGCDLAGALISKTLDVFEAEERAFRGNISIQS